MCSCLSDGRDALSSPALKRSDSTAGSRNESGSELQTVGLATEKVWLPWSGNIKLPATEGDRERSYDLMALYKYAYYYYYYIELLWELGSWLDLQHVQQHCSLQFISNSLYLLAYLLTELAAWLSG